jgi:D-arabinose 1-dehydrogenase-like Zn-dependent alcohol dehydrogenase
MAKMRAVQVGKPGGELELVEREIPAPGRDEALVRVHACGVCHSDSYARIGAWPGMKHPLVPGHEIAGVIAELGADVRGWEVGQRVGVGWYGGNCGYCAGCRRGDLVNCSNMTIPGVTADGGYADYAVVRASALARMPDGLEDAEAAPLMCAGITTFNGLRQSGARGGDLVAILGLGGLGHLGVQFATKLGFETVAIARGADKEELARSLGARHYIDSRANDPAEELRKLGGAKVILATAASGEAMSAVFGGLATRGKMVIVGSSREPVAVPAAMFLAGSKTISGHASGVASDSEDTLAFALLSGVRPLIEERPLEDAPAAYERMMSGEARFRMVLKLA